MPINQCGIESALLKMDKAHEALQSGDRGAAWDYYHKVCIEYLPEKDFDKWR